MTRARLLILSALALPFVSVHAQQPAFDRTRPPTLGAAPTLTIPSVRASRLSSGAALKVVEQRELPLVHVTLQFAGGGRLDNDMPGLASFVATMVREGAGTRDANALQSELAYLGATLSANADWDNTSITLRVAKRNLDAALDLMADVVLRPTFAAADVRRQRDLRLAALLQQRDQPRTLATMTFNRALFPAGHPYRQSLGGDSASTAALDSAVVRAFHDGAYRPLRATFTVVGDIDETEARSQLDRRFGNWAIRGAERRPAPVLVAATRSPARRVILVDKPGAAQSVIMIGAPGLERTTPDYAAIQVMNTILGGSFSSRLNTTLRETKGYTYGASSGFQWRPLPGAFVASSDVRTDVTDSSLVEFFREIRTLRDTLVSEGELARAKAFIALGIPGDFESTAQIAGQVTALALFNLPLAWLQEYVAAVNAVTAADVQRVARRYVPDDAATVIVVGDLAKVRAGIEALNLGPVTVVPVEELARP
ncbi:pitrilysin family protein [Pseudogemmatithrix spongiicola]|uniref:Pitrilysin family protein n=1 Tax=Pseudogemmatithrix spongiicola TaxID=3062599 RepID=A0AA49Q6F3_9BACT|nr:pitrilysin family protein [Gemmatimonadaceae bacterium 'strain 138']WKW16525.1 pitrilysin family protein [Gemmatimonadaceae bacterium 'strain 318']